MAKKDKIQITIIGRSARRYNNGNGAVSLRPGGHYELPKRVAEFFIQQKWAKRGFIEYTPKKSAIIKKLEAMEKDPHPQEVVDSFFKRLDEYLKPEKKKAGRPPKEK